MESPREVINTWAARLLGDPERAAKLGAVYRLVVEGDGGGTWLVSCAGRPSVEEERGGAAAPADCTVTVGGSDLVSLAGGKLNPQAAFLQGRLKVSGNAALALRLTALMGE